MGALNRQVLRGNITQPQRIPPNVRVVGLEEIVMERTY